MATGVATRDEAAVVGAGFVSCPALATAARRIRKPPMKPFGPVRGYGFLIRAEDLTATNVIKVDSFVPVFTDPTVASRWIEELAMTGVDVGITACRNADEMTSLLADLRSIGATHVGIDPEPADRERTLITIEEAIIGFSVAG